MKVEGPNPQQLTAEEIQELEHLRGLIEQAVANGVVTKEEEFNIKAWALHSKPRYELLSQELAMYRELVTNKINAGLLSGETLTDC
ncbi:MULTISPECIES: hypothetical protein [unclassified Synechocystis]|uniref:hypothetical protein n=1 Tax=unclassified Synechocystis TaxID=2640012 RepID=UPI001CBE6092|nr:MULTISPECIES: hypothetical protein [unclassified Synechocystis]